MGIGVKSLVSNDLLLNYSIKTNPEPLVVSPRDSAANPTIAAIEIVISNNRLKPVYCTEIDFSFMISDTAQGLTESGKNILATVSPNDKWDIGETGEGQFTVTPKKQEYGEITSDGIVVQIYDIQVNKTVGNAEFYVDENSSETSFADVEKHSGTYYLAKFPYGFYVKNFHADKPFVNNGEKVTLYWIGSVNAIYTLYFSPEIPPEDVSTVRTWVSPKLNQQTVFQLTVKAQEFGETVDLVLSATVLVVNPEIIATSLQVKGDTHLNTLHVEGQSTQADTSISNLTLNGKLSGQLALAASLTAVQAFQTVSPATYVANTDGIIIGQINAPAGNSNRTSYGIIGGRSGDANVYCTGGYNVIRYMGNNNTISGSQYGNFYLPVPKGTQWSVASQLYDHNDVNPAVTFYWVALSSNNGQPTYTKISSDPSVVFPK